MRLDECQLELRPRGPFEAVDLGQVMYRRWWWPLHQAWLVTFLPLAVGLALALPDRPGLALVLLWWLLPLVERGPLWVLGRRVFGAPTRLSELLAALPRLWSRRLLWRLTVARPSPWRGFAAPVAVLEQLDGTAARRRTSTLMAGGREGTVALALTLVCWSFQVGLAVALYGLVGALLPSAASEALGAAVERWASEPRGESWPGLLLYGLACLALTAVGPLFVSSSFALYLNRRTFLEGWDVEVAFRSLAERLARPGRRGALVALLLALVLGAGTGRADAAPLAHSPARVATAQEQGADAAAREAAERVLAHPDFDRTRTVRRPVSRGPERPRLPGLEVLAQLVRLVLVLGGVAIVLWLVFVAARRRERASGPRAAGAPPAPVRVAGLDVRAESLPADPAAEAARLWGAQRAHEALSLLYRAAIARLVHAFLVPIAEGDTEGQCLARVVSVGERAPRAPFERLTAVWQRCAYGRELPADDQFRALVEEWRGAFGGGA